jgi:hypothetical protein
VDEGVCWLGQKNDRNIFFTLFISHFIGSFIRIRPLHFVRPLIRFGSFFRTGALSNSIFSTLGILYQCQTRTEQRSLMYEITHVMQSGSAFVGSVSENICYNLWKRVTVLTEMIPKILKNKNEAIRAEKFDQFFGQYSFFSRKKTRVNFFLGANQVPNFVSNRAIQISIKKTESPRLLRIHPIPNLHEKNLKRHIELFQFLARQCRKMNCENCLKDTRAISKISLFAI